MRKSLAIQKYYVTDQQTNVKSRVSATKNSGTGCLQHFLNADESLNEPDRAIIGSVLSQDL